MSLGEDRVRVKFNPSQTTLVDQIKQKSAELIDLCQDLKGAPVENSERARCASLAQTYFETGAMYAVKAATYE